MCGTDARVADITHVARGWAISYRSRRVFYLCNTILELWKNHRADLPILVLIYWYIDVLDIPAISIRSLRNNAPFSIITRYPVPLHSLVYIYWHFQANIQLIWSVFNLASIYISVHINARKCPTSASMNCDTPHGFRFKYQFCLYFERNNNKTEHIHQRWWSFHSTQIPEKFFHMRIPKSFGSGI